MPRVAPIAQFMASKRLPFDFGVVLELGEFCDDGSIAMALCEP